MTQTTRTRKLWLALGGLLVILLVAAVFTLGSLNTPFQPDSPNQLLLLYALSTFIVAALMVFGLILTRSLLKVWAERQAGQLGSHFKWKMVTGAMAISLLPVIFMFIISYALMNRTLNKWFPRPLEIATASSQKMLFDLGRAENERLSEIARIVAQTAVTKDRKPNDRTLSQEALQFGADAAWEIFQEGGKTTGHIDYWSDRIKGESASIEHRYPEFIRALSSGIEIWKHGDVTYMAAKAPVPGGIIVVGRKAPADFVTRYDDIQNQVAAYNQQYQQLRAFKGQMLLGLLLFTLLVLFSTTWTALFLSKLVTVPIQSLAEATHEIAKGNLEFRVDVKAQDELGTLVQSFNQMTAQLADSRKQINEFNNSLQLAITELESRRKVMEAILENIPTGVLSLDSGGTILRASPAVASIFGDHARKARSLTEILGPETAQDVEQLMRKALRMGTASKEFSIPLIHPGASGRMLQAAVTVSALGPRRTTSGFVVVIDDLTDLLRAQKAAAWQEVAQRIAHEIKNPLTPIQLSAQRLSRHLEKSHSQAAIPGMAAPNELESLVAECAGLIEREVSTLKSLVDEFSQFARFPTVKPVSMEMNSLVSSALEVFSGRLDGMKVSTSLASGLPNVKADPELLRRVVINLIDNAAEALEGSSVREITLKTSLDANGDTVEISVEDSGHGISPEDKDKLFLPHFSTKARGTGLGLAIASRIIEEHHGTIRVEDNQPVGARFVIRLPVAEVAVNRS